MKIEYRDKNGVTKIVEAEYLTVEDAWVGEIRNGRWIFKSYGEILRAGDTYTASESGEIK